MRFMDMLYFSLRGVMRGRAKMTLSALAVAIGVSSVLLISSLGEAGRQAIVGQLEQIGISGLTLYADTPATSGTLTASDVSLVEKCVSEVVCAMPVNIEYGGYKLKNWQGSAVIWGVGNDLDQIMNLKVSYGRLPNSTEIEYGVRVAVIDDMLANKIYKRDNIVGKTIALSLGSCEEHFKIIGVVSSQKNGLSQLVGESIPEFVYVPYTVLSGMTGSDSIDQIAIRCMSGAQLDKTGQTITKVMNRRHRTQEGFAIENISGYRDKLNSIISLISLLISAIAAISLGVAGLGVMNSMLSSTSERRREIGVCMAIGAQRRDIAVCFLLEASIVCAIGGLFGVLSGTLLSVAVTEYLSIAPMIKIEHILISEMISTFFGLFFGVVPAIRASGLDPIFALKEE